MPKLVCATPGTLWFVEAVIHCINDQIFGTSGPHTAGWYASSQSQPKRHYSSNNKVVSVRKYGHGGLSRWHMPCFCGSCMWRGISPMPEYHILWPLGDGEVQEGIDHPACLLNRLTMTPSRLVILCALFQHIEEFQSNTCILGIGTSKCINPPHHFWATKRYVRKIRGTR